MEEPTQKLSVGELKFRKMVEELGGKPKGTIFHIDCPTSSKARALRRMFYIWQTKLAPREQNLISKFQYKVKGRTLHIVPLFDWTAKSKEVPNVSPSQGKSA
jgi:hypothetical protein